MFREGEGMVARPVKALLHMIPTDIVNFHEHQHVVRVLLTTHRIHLKTLYKVPLQPRTAIT